MSVYEIWYDYTDATREQYTNREEFKGTWSELQDYVKELKLSDCFNIEANYLCDEEDNDE